MSKENNLIHQTVRWGGGYVAVGKENEVSDVAVHGWVKRGLPPTEWTGETGYAKVMVKMARKNGFHITRKQLLDFSLKLRHS